MKLSSKIKKSAIKLEMSAKNKEEALVELVDLLCSAYSIKEKEKVLEAIKKREEKQSTGLGMGLAVPHAKTDAVDKLYTAFGRSKEVWILIAQVEKKLTCFSYSYHPSM